MTSCIYKYIESKSELYGSRSFLRLGKPSKTQPLINLTSDLETLDDREPTITIYTLAIGTWKIKGSSK